MATLHGSITLDWGDGTKHFRLGLAEIEELEEKTNKGIFTIGAGLSPALRLAKLVEIREVIRLGLIGGGSKPADALTLVRRYIDERPLEESRDVAYVVVLAAINRVHPDSLEEEATDDPPGERPAAMDRPASTSPQYTGPAS